MIYNADYSRRSVPASVNIAALKNKKSITDKMWGCPDCDSYRIQTCNLLIRSQMLYSVELMSRQ